MHIYTYTHIYTHIYIYIYAHIYSRILFIYRVKQEDEAVFLLYGMHRRLGGKTKQRWPLSVSFLFYVISGFLKREHSQDSPGSPGAKTLPSQGRGPRFETWSGNQIPYATTVFIPQIKIPHAAAKTQGSQINQCMYTVIKILNSILSMCDIGVYIGGALKIQ